MVGVNQSIYITDTAFLYQTDLYLNIIKMIDIYNYHSIVYNSFDNRLYASSFDLLAIVIYDLNLNLIDSLSTLSYEPWSLNCLNN